VEITSSRPESEDIAGDGRRPSDWIVAAVVLLLGAAETLSAGLGWPLLRASLAVVFAVALTQRRRYPLEVLVVVVVLNLVADIALTVAGHSVLFSGVAVVIAFFAIARWTDGRRLLAGLGIIAAHAVALLALDPNMGVNAVILLHAGPVILAIATRPRSHADRPAVRRLRGAAVVLVLVWLFSVAQGAFLSDEFAGYITRTRSPEPEPDWWVDSATLREAAEASRGTHGPDGAIRHTVDYPDQLLDALESPTSSIEGNVSVVDGVAVLQHDPRYAVGMDLMELLEDAAIADIPIVKLDLKRDHVDVVIDDVDEAIDRFGLDPTRLQFNADVIRGPGVEEDRFGARADKPFDDRMYNLLVMELEVDDLARIAEHFPESTIVISAFTPTGPVGEGYSADHLAQFLDAADEIRRASPGQRIGFALRGDLAALSGPEFVGSLLAIGDSYVATWWSSDPRPTDAEVEALRAAGVTVFDDALEAER
jgi:hypothetical protein